MKPWGTGSGQTLTRLLGGGFNVFLLSHTGSCLLIDTGPKWRSQPLVRALERLHVTHIDYLILTHVHYDHAGNARLVQNEFDAKVIVHEKGKEFLCSGKNEPIRGTNVITKAIARLGPSILQRAISFEPLQPAMDIHDKCDLTPLGFNCYALSTPGHTPGSVSVIVDDEIAVVGDALFGILPGSVFPPFAYDVRTMVNSWGELLNTGCRIFLPTHGAAVKRDLLAREYERFRYTY